MLIVENLHFRMGWGWVIIDDGWQAKGLTLLCITDNILILVLVCACLLKRLLSGDNRNS